MQAAVCLLVAFVLGLPSVLRLTEPPRPGSIKSHRCCFWWRCVRLDTASPGWLASPAGQTGDPGPDRCVNPTAATLGSRMTLARCGCYEVLPALLGYQRGRSWGLLSTPQTRSNTPH